MKIKMTYDDLFGIVNIMNKFSYVAGPLAIAMHRTRNRMDEEINIFMEERNKLMQKYGTLNEETGQYEIQPDSENMEAFSKEFIPLVRETVEIEFYDVTKEVFEKSNIYDVPSRMLEDKDNSVTYKDFDILEQLFVTNPQTK